MAMRVTVEVGDDDTLALACPADATVEWLLAQCEARAHTPLRALHGADGAFLDPLDRVCDACAPLERLRALPPAPRVASADSLGVARQRAARRRAAVGGATRGSDDESELRMPLGVAGAALPARVRLDAPVDDSPADVLRMVFELAPALPAPPPHHRYALRRAGASEPLALSASLLELGVQPHETLELVLAAGIDVFKSPRGQELARKLTELGEAVAAAAPAGDDAAEPEAAPVSPTTAAGSGSKRRNLFGRLKEQLARKSASPPTSLRGPSPPRAADATAVRVTRLSRRVTAPRLGLAHQLLFTSASCVGDVLAELGAAFGIVSDERSSGARARELARWSLWTLETPADGAPRETELPRDATFEPFVDLLLRAELVLRHDTDIDATTTTTTESSHSTTAASRIMLRRNRSGILGGTAAIARQHLSDDDAAQRLAPKRTPTPPLAGALDSVHRADSSRSPDAVVNGGVETSKRHSDHKPTRKRRSKKSGKAGNRSRSNSAAKALRASSGAGSELSDSRSPASGKSPRSDNEVRHSPARAALAGAAAANAAAANASADTSTTAADVVPQQIKAVGGVLSDIRHRLTRAASNSGVQTAESSAAGEATTKEADARAPAGTSTVADQQLRDILMQTLERLDRLADQQRELQRIVAQRRESVQLSSDERPSALPQSVEDWPPLSPRSAGALLRRSMLLRTVSAERGAREPTISSGLRKATRVSSAEQHTNSDSEQPGPPSRWSHSLSAATDDEAARRRGTQSAVRVERTVPALPRFESFPQPETLASSVGKPSVADWVRSGNKPDASQAATRSTMPHGASPRSAQRSAAAQSPARRTRSNATWTRPSVDAPPSDSDESSDEFARAMRSPRGSVEADKSSGLARVDYEWRGARIHVQPRARARSQPPLSLSLSRPMWLDADDDASGRTNSGSHATGSSELGDAVAWRASLGDSDDERNAGGFARARSHKQRRRQRRAAGRNMLRVRSDALVRNRKIADMRRGSNDENSSLALRELDEPRRLLRLKQHRRASGAEDLPRSRSTLSSPRSVLSSPRSSPLSSPRPHAPLAAAAEAMMLLGKEARVEMRECLAESGHTSVYRCVVRGATFACKVFRGERASRGERAAAWREVTVLSSLTHANIEQFAGQVNVGDELRLFVEFSLTTLADVLAIRRAESALLGAADCSTMALEIARGLRYLHTLARPVVHLGLRPDAVLYQADDYGRDFVLKIGLFTEARQYSSVASATAASALLRRSHEPESSSSSHSLNAGKAAATASVAARDGAELVSGDPRSDGDESAPLDGGDANAAQRASDDKDSELLDMLPDGWFEELSVRLGASAALVAPELHTHHSVPLLTAHDCWSFGFVLFELLYGEPPYAAERISPYDIARRVERAQLPEVPQSASARSAQPTLQPAVRLMRRCLAASAAKRPRAAHICRSLERWQQIVRPPKRN